MLSDVYAAELLYRRETERRAVDQRIRDRVANTREARPQRRISHRIVWARPIAAAAPAAC